jgi:hypothetical protein
VVRLLLLCQEPLEILDQIQYFLQLHQMVAAVVVLMLEQQEALVKTVGQEVVAQ